MSSKNNMVDTRNMTLWEQTAVRWAEHIVETGGDTSTVALLLRLVAGGLPDEGALAEALDKVGATVAQAYRVIDATVYLGGKRVRPRADPCSRSWDPGRPCVLAPGHADHCILADVNTAHQRESAAKFMAEVGAVALACAGACYRPRTR